MSRVRDLAFAELAPKLSNCAIARIYEVDEATVRRGLKRVGYNSQLVLPLYPDVVLDAPIDITLDKLAITADWHIPLTDFAYVNDFTADCRERGVKDLLIGGDFFNFDSLSQYDPKQQTAGLKRELDEGMNVMNALLGTFDRIYYIWGNHDARLHRSLGFKLEFDEAMRLVFGAIGEDALERITFSNLDHAYATVAGERWYICHPQNYSKIPLSTPRQLAAKVGCNVVTAHAHHLAIGYAVDGKNVVVEAGGFFDKTKTAYLQRSTTFPNWTQGYLLLDGNDVLINSPRFRS